MTKPSTTARILELRRVADVMRTTIDTLDDIVIEARPWSTSKLDDAIARTRAGAVAVLTTAHADLLFLAIECAHDYEEEL